MIKFKYILILFLTTLSACGKNNIDVLLHPKNKNKNVSRFFLSTQEELLTKYEVLKKIDLYEVLPHLDSLPIEYDSFAEIKNILEIEAQKYQANRAVLKKTNDCLATVGYCEAYLIKKK